MKILIKGSIDDPNFKEAFIKVCRDLGQKLSEDKHSLMIGSYRQDTVGPHVAEGASTTTKKTLIIESYRPEGEKAPNINNIKFISRINEEGPWSIALLPALDVADAVILIGGGDNTRSIGFAARALRKTLLAIPLFEGAARDIWRLSQSGYTQAGVSEADLVAFQDSWRDDSADAVARVVKQLAKKNPFRSNAALYLLTIFTVALLTLWGVVFLGLFHQAANMTLLLLLAISAMLGTASRIYYQLSMGKVVELTSRDMLIETGSGLLLALIFDLLYIVGGSAYDVQPMLKEEVYAPSIAAVFVSLVGIAAAFLLDWGIVKRRLGERLSSTTS
jgi:hypothetical protein